MPEREQLAAVCEAILAVAGEVVAVETLAAAAGEGTTVEEVEAALELLRSRHEGP
jgi:chromosome segregation and condensation protein ScpB